MGQHTMSTYSTGDLPLPPATFSLIKRELQRVGYEHLVRGDRLVMHGLAVTKGEAITGADLIASERRRQVYAEGYTPDQDKHYGSDELVNAALCYVESSIGCCGQLEGVDTSIVPPCWPWSGLSWKPKNRAADLVRAGGLIAAELDRMLEAGLIDRATLPGAE